MIASSMEFTGVPTPALSIDPPSSKEEEDLLARNAIKLKEQEGEDFVPEMQATQTAEKENQINTEQKAKKATVSYRDSLLKYNGMSNLSNMETDSDMVIEEDDSEWEPSEATKKLMDVYLVLPISNEEWKELCKPWKNALVITILGLRVNLKFLKYRLSKLWSISEFELIDLMNNYYIIRLPDPNGYERILNGGPWVILDHCILVQRWCPSFNPNQNELGKVAVWVRIPNLPMPMYNKEMLWRVGNCIGRTLKVDLNSLNQTEGEQWKTDRGQFARISVEIDLRKKLVSRLLVRDEICRVEYESLNLICFGCGCYHVVEFKGLWEFLHGYV